MSTIEYVHKPTQMPVTVYTIAVCREQGNERIYVVQDAYKDHRWSLPGGVVELAETVVQAAEREFKEETGKQVIIERLIGMFALRKTPGQIVLFRGSVPSFSHYNIESPIDPGEISEVRLCTKEELKVLDLYPAQKTLVSYFTDPERAKLFDPTFGYLIPPLLT